MDNRKISLCIPVYNRFELLLESFDKVKDDPRISEICIYSDGSNWEYNEKLCNNLVASKFLGGDYVFPQNITSIYPKLKLTVNSTNLGVHFAKRNAVAMASNPFVILFDSDNVISIDYLDILYSILEWDENMAYQPSYLYPNFDFRDKEGLTVSKSNLQQVLNTPNNRLDTWGNAQNFFIHRDNYLKVWEEGTNVNGNDSLWFFYLWMKAGKSMTLVPNLKYFHRIHNELTPEQKGNYNSDVQAGHKVAQTMNLIKNLK